MTWKKPDKIELAKMKILSNLGNTPNAIGRKIGRDPRTVRKHLGIPENFQDPEVLRLVAKIKDDEINNLYLLGEKAKQRLHEILDEGKTRAIETTAILDRTFQQRRLLENLPTENISTRSIAVHLQGVLRDLKAREQKLLANLEEREAEEIATNVASEVSCENP